MELHELKTVPGSRRPRKRRGRGSGSGLGKTSGRGHKGQKARSGYKSKPGFEGGQMPLKRRLPKVGFTPLSTTVYTPVNLSDLAGFPEGSEITPELLRESGLIKNLKNPVKILGRGKIEIKLTVRADRFSASARSAIEAAGGACLERAANTPSA